MRRECAKSPEIKGTEIGSITKTFTATAVLQLNEQGKLSLDDTLDMYFPEFKNGKDITLCQLHPTVAGDNFSNECMQNIIVAARM